MIMVLLLSLFNAARNWCVSYVNNLRMTFLLILKIMLHFHAYVYTYATNVANYLEVTPPIL